MRFNSKKVLEIYFKSIKYLVQYFVNYLFGAEIKVTLK